MKDCLKSITPWSIPCLVTLLDKFILLSWTGFGSATNCSILKMELCIKRDFSGNWKSIAWGKLHNTREKPCF